MDNLAHSLNKNSAKLSMEIGDYYFNGGAYDLDRASQAYKQALIINPNIPVAHYQLGRILFVSGRFNIAIQEINKEIELFPSSPHAYYARGLVYGYRSYPDDFENAERDFKNFIAWMPKSWAGYNDLAWVQIKQKKYKEAKQTLELGFDNVPETQKKNMWMLASLGIVHLNLKNYNEARDIFLTVKDISEKMTSQNFWSAYPGNDPRNAGEAFNQFNSTLHFNLGVVYENLGETSLAKEEYETYLKLLPKGPFPQKYEIEQKINELSAHI